MLRASPIEKRSRVGQRALDQLVGMPEVDWLDSERARRWQNDELRAIAVQLDVGDQPTLRQQCEGMQRQAERARRRLLERAGVTARQHVDLASPKLHSMRDRRVVGD